MCPNHSKHYFMGAHPKQIGECINQLEGKTTLDLDFKAKMAKVAERLDAVDASEEGETQLMPLGEHPESVQLGGYLDGSVKYMCLALTESQYATEMNLKNVRVKDVKGVPLVYLPSRDDLSMIEIHHLVQFISGTEYLPYELHCGNRLPHDVHYLVADKCVYPQQGQDVEKNTS